MKLTNSWRNRRKEDKKRYGHCLLVEINHFFNPVSADGSFEVFSNTPPITSILDVMVNIIVYAVVF